MEKRYDVAVLEQRLRFANAAAYLVTTKKGVIRSMPEKEQVLELRAQHEMEGSYAVFL